MTIVVNLAPDQEARLRERAARMGLSAEEFASRTVAAAGELVAIEPVHSPQVSAILAFAARLRAGDAEALRIQTERNERVIALLDRWEAEPIDLDEVEGYPEVIPRLRVRQHFVRRG